MFIAAAVAAVLPAASAIAQTAAHPLDPILAGSHRSDVNRARDVYRHPKETLDFFGVKPTSKVLEIWPGGGWYTEVLSPYLRDKGQYIAVFPSQSTRGLQNFKDKLAKAPAALRQDRDRPTRRAGQTRYPS